MLLSTSSQLNNKTILIKKKKKLSVSILLNIVNDIFFDLTKKSNLERLLKLWT